jgi:hypothetical protein
MDFLAARAASMQLVGKSATRASRYSDALSGSGVSGELYVDRIAAAITAAKAGSYTEVEVPDR